MGRRVGEGGRAGGEEGQEGRKGGGREVAGVRRREAARCCGDFQRKNQSELRYRQLSCIYHVQVTRGKGQRERDRGRGGEGREGRRGWGRSGWEGGGRGGRGEGEGGST